MSKIAPVVFVLAVAAFMRFYRLPELFHWTMDEEFWSYLPFNIATAYHFPLIGGHIAGTGLYSGPLFVYLMALPAKIFAGNPLGLGYTMAFVGTVAAAGVYFLGKKMAGKETALAAALLYAGSFLMAIFDRHYWNASLTPVLSLLVIYLTYIFLQGQGRAFLFLAPVLALAFHAHGTGMALLIFILAALLLFRPKTKPILFAAGAGIFLLLQLPLIVFDWRHDFLNLRAVQNNVMRSTRVDVPAKTREITAGFVLASSRLIYTPARDIVQEQTLPRSQYAPSVPPPALTVAVIITLGLIIYYGAVRKREPIIGLCFLMVAATLAGLFLYREAVPEYFYCPAFVALFYIYGYGLALFLRKPRICYLAAGILLVYLAANGRTMAGASHSDPYERKEKAAREIIAAVGGTPFSLAVRCAGSPCQLFGYRYLFTYLGREPAQSYMDAYFNWLYERRKDGRAPGKEVTILVGEGETRYEIKNL